MSCNLGKTGTRFAVNSQVFVILFWFLVDISSSRQEQNMRGTRGTRFSKVFIRVLVTNVDCIPGQNHKFESENVAAGSGK